MGGFLCPIHLGICCRKQRVVFASVWLFGLLCGMSLALSQSIDLSYYFAFYTTSIHVSLLFLLVARILPLVVSYFSLRYLLLPVVFIKAILLSFTSVSILISLDSSVWLILLLFLFSDILTLPVLLWFWLCLIETGERNSLGNHILGTALIALISLFDYMVVSPFLVRLLSF